MATLKDDIAADLYNVHLNVNEFGEWITYYPARGGAPRRMVAKITHKERIEQGQVIDVGLEEITVEVGSNESHSKGGVSRPVHSASATDALARDGDSESARFAFTGECKELMGGWSMIFSRPKGIQTGTDHIRR